MGALSRCETVLEWAMSESVSVRCPACRREQLYTAPSYPCVCGTAVTPLLDPGGTATAVAHRAWDEEWVTVRCAACGRLDQWPRPELGCPCGTVLRVPLSGPRDTSAPEGGATAPARRRPAFQPVTIRTARDAVTAAALYLRWLGYRDIRRADQRPPSGIGIAARGLLAQIDPTVRPASPRDVECLWLTAMTESTDCVYFSLAGYAPDARSRADTLGVPLFVLDLTGTPQPVNGLADEWDATGAR
jgi:ribosomal protein S27E